MNETRETALHDRVVLIVEDEYLIADDLASQLAEAGAKILGPAPSIAKARELLDVGTIDCAVLDVNLRGERVYPLADTLLERDVPVVFVTGYDAHVIPERFGAVPRCEKPAQTAAVVETIRAALLRA